MSSYAPLDETKQGVAMYNPVLPTAADLTATSDKAGSNDAPPPSPPVEASVAAGFLGGGQREGGERGGAAASLSRLAALTREMVSLRETAQAARSIIKLRGVVGDSHMLQDENSSGSTEASQASALACARLDQRLLRVLQAPLSAVSSSMLPANGEGRTGAGEGVAVGRQAVACWGDVQKEEAKVGQNESRENRRDVNQNHGLSDKDIDDIAGAAAGARGGGGVSCQPDVARFTPVSVESSASVMATTDLGIYSNELSEVVNASSPLQIRPQSLSPDHPLRRIEPQGERRSSEPVREALTRGGSASSGEMFDGSRGTFDSDAVVSHVQALVKPTSRQPARLQQTAPQPTHSEAAPVVLPQLRPQETGADSQAGMPCTGPHAAEARAEVMTPDGTLRMTSSTEIPSSLEAPGAAEQAPALAALDSAKCVCDADAGVHARQGDVGGGICTGSLVLGDGSFAQTSTWLQAHLLQAAQTHASAEEGGVHERGHDKRSMEREAARALAATQAGRLGSASGSNLRMDWQHFYAQALADVRRKGHVALFRGLDGPTTMVRGGESSSGAGASAATDAAVGARALHHPLRVSLCLLFARVRMLMPSMLTM